MIVPGGLSNQPRLVKGALVDVEVLSVPPLIVPFQFNPESIQRRLSASLRDPAARQGRDRHTPLGQSLGEGQNTLAQPETISLDIRLDATDALEAGSTQAARLGVLPAMSALEMMITPRSQSMFGGVLGMSASFGFGDRDATPVLVFVWGRHRVYPVRLTELSINETEYSPDLSPIRVIATVSMQVLGGPNAFNAFTVGQREVLAGLNLGAAASRARTIINLG